MRKRATVSRTTFLWLLAMGVVMLPSASASALAPFTDGTMDLGNPEGFSGVGLGIYDMDGDGLDDIVRLINTDLLQIEYQQEGGGFEMYEWGDVPGSGTWNVTIGDVDKNGYADIFAGGIYDGLKLLTATDDGSNFMLTTLPPPSVFVQCANFVDIDNNGTLDLFVCHDEGLSAPFNNDGTGDFTYDIGLINAVATNPGGDSGNYGTTWTDYDHDGDLDLYIAKCRLGVNDANDGRRTNLMFQNDGAGNFTEVAPDIGLQPLAQSWAADFGDIDNDGDFDVFVINHDLQSMLFENLGPDNMGMFDNITAPSTMGADLNALGLGIQTHFEDFDNDTFIDLLVTGRSGEHRLFINNGDMTFTAEDAPFPTGNLGIQSAAVGDLNDDGFPDILAGFATGFNQPSGLPDGVYYNPGNDNNWINIWLTGVESNGPGTGAMIELHGEWGMQLREVRNGESYGITNSATRHFGLGAAEEITQIVINWPSGHVDTIDDPPINATLHVTEGCPDVFYVDADGDGFGDPDQETTACIAGAGVSEDNTDCDDEDENNYPGNEEVCDEADNNCDGEIDEGLDDCGGSESSTTDVTDTDPTGTTMTGMTATTAPTASGTTETASGGETDTDGPGADTDSDGCGCVVDKPSRGAWLLFLVVGLLRRRRR